MGVRARHQDVFLGAADFFYDLLRQFFIGILGEHAQVCAQEDGFGDAVV